MKLLIALDLRGNAAQVVRGVLPWIHATGSTVDLVFIDDSRLGLPHIHDAHVRRLMEKEWAAYRRQDLEALDGMMALVPESNRGVCRVAEGAAAETLIELAAEYDGVAVCTHGRTGMTRLVLGSVAERVVRQSPTPVLVLPQSSLPPLED